MMMKVSDIMTRNVVTIRNSATVAEAAQVMQEQGVTVMAGGRGKGRIGNRLGGSLRSWRWCR